MSFNNVTNANFSPLRGRDTAGSTIIAVGGGKGGVGKSFVSSSLCIFLAQLGYRTVGIDLDLGGANLHTNLGLPVSPRGINEFILDSSMPFTELMQPTHWPNLSLISGSSEANDVANIDERQRSRVMSAIYRNQADFTILDLSAGTHQATLDFFLMAKHKVVVFTPEPSSIENAYRFLKATFFRRLRRFEHQLHIQGQVDELLANRATYGIRNPSDFLRILAEREPSVAGKVREIGAELNFQIVLNQARTRQEVEMGLALQSVCTKYFGFPSEFLGGLEYDNAVWQSLRQRHHLLQANRSSHLYAQLMSIARKLAAKIDKTQDLKAVI
jgi:flagellar biosynthesis protein FlhG